MKVLFLKILFLITLLFLPPLSASAQQKPIIDIDGNNWRQWAPQQKSSFLEGFISCAHYVITYNKDHIKYAGEEFTPKKGSEIYLASLDEKKKTFTRQEMQLLMEYAAFSETSVLGNYSVANITLGQISDGLDSFYRDPNNRKIKISDAIYVVKRQNQGASSEELEMLCQWLRSDRAPDKRYYTDKDGKKKFLYFP